MLDDIRDESAEDIRIVIEPKSKNMAPEQIMAVLFKQTDLETRFSLNMNVLDNTGVPRVMGCAMCSANGLNTAMMFWCAKASFGWQKSKRALRCWMAISLPI